MSHEPILLLPLTPATKPRLSNPFGSTHVSQCERAYE